LLRARQVPGQSEPACHNSLQIQRGTVCRGAA
jgi:hypothetical protein